MKLIPLTLLTLLVSTTALAQYTGPSATARVKAAPAAAPGGAAMNVRDLLAKGKDDTMVSVQGRIVRHLGGDKYRFADSTGEIDVEIDADKWPANTPIDDKVQVRLQGEYDKKLLTDSEIEVERVEKVK